MNQNSQTIHIQSSYSLFNKLNFHLKFGSLGSKSKFNDLKINFFFFFQLYVVEILKKL